MSNFFIYLNIQDWLIDCLMPHEQYFSYIYNEGKFTNSKWSRKNLALGWIWGWKFKIVRGKKRGYRSTKYFGYGQRILPYNRSPTTIPKTSFHSLRDAATYFYIQCAWNFPYKRHSLQSHPKGKLCICFVLHI